MGFYIESVDRPYTSAVVSEDIHVGTLAVKDAGNARRAEAADSNVMLAAAPRRGDYIAEDSQVAGGVTDAETTTFKYLASEDDRAPLQPLADRDVVKVRTAADNATDPAPSISAGDVVGIAAVGGEEFEGRIVEEGYTDNGGTTYGRESTGDFYALGTAMRDESSEYDHPVRVRVLRADI